MAEGTTHYNDKFDFLHPIRKLCVMFDWIDYFRLGDKNWMSSICIFYFVRDDRDLHFKILEFPLPQDICAKFGWNSPNSFFKIRKCESSQTYWRIIIPKWTDIVWLWVKKDIVWNFLTYKILTPWGILYPASSMSFSMNLLVEKVIGYNLWNKEDILSKSRYFLFYIFINMFK